ncbi:MAG: hypothetical protein RL885_16120 [Planctomycetota bacterium]
MKKSSTQTAKRAATSPLRATLLIGLAVVALPSLASAQPSRSRSSAQPLGIVFRQIASPDSAVRPLGNRPALHRGQVAFYGYRGASYGTDVVMAIRRADGKGAFSILAAEGDPRPDEAGSTFDHFGNPALFDGEAVFLGGEFGTLSSTYSASISQPYQLFDDRGINNPFFGALGVTTPASPQGIAYRDPNGVFTFLGLYQDPLPCGTGSFAYNNVPGLRYVPQGGDLLVWPALANTSDYAGDLIAGYDTTFGQLYCVATGLDTIPGLGTPFDFFYKADTDGDRVAFIGMDDTSGFGRHEGVYVRDASGTGPITLIADVLTAAPGGGTFGSFEAVSIDGDLVIFEGCAGGSGGCAVYGFFGCFVRNGTPGPIFEILNTGQMIGGRPIIDLTMSPTGRDGNRFAFDVRHAANSASLYVATIRVP